MRWIDEDYRKALEVIFGEGDAPITMPRSEIVNRAVRVLKLIVSNKLIRILGGLTDEEGRSTGRTG